MLAFLATALPLPYLFQNPKREIWHRSSDFWNLVPRPKMSPVLTRAICEHFSCSVTSTARYYWALRSLNTTTGESIRLKHKDFPGYFDQRMAFKLRLQIWSKQSIYLAAALWPTKSLVYAFTLNIIVWQNSYLIFHTCSTKAESKRSIYW